MMFKQFKVVFVLLLLFSFFGYSSVQGQYTIEFEFQLTNENIVSISNYNEKPILIEWAATWCPVCKANQKEINKVYNDYKDNITFISLSFGGSGDTIQEVKDMKFERGYKWIFGLDIYSYGPALDTYNGDTWLINTDLQFVKKWDYVLITAADLIEQFEGDFTADQSITFDTLPTESDSNTSEAPFLILSFFLSMLIILPLARLTRKKN